MEITIFFKIASAKKPLKKAEINPKAKTFSGISLSISSRQSKIKAAAITGIAIKKDSIKASSLLKPLLSRPVMVIPERDMPGKKATPCNTPKMRESLIPIDFKLRELASFRTLISIIALAKKQVARKYLLRNKSLKITLTVKPMQPVKNVITISCGSNFRENNKCRCLER